METVYHPLRQILVGENIFGLLGKVDRVGEETSPWEDLDVVPQMAGHCVLSLHVHINRPCMKVQVFLLLWQTLKVLWHVPDMWAGNACIGHLTRTWISTCDRILVRKHKLCVLANCAILAVDTGSNGVLILHRFSEKDDITSIGDSQQLPKDSRE